MTFAEVIATMCHTIIISSLPVVQCSSLNHLGNKIGSINRFAIELVKVTNPYSKE
jgi:hypothetical protein